ncbi:MAG: carbohydrate kinase family protein, partial [Paracoccus sp. (in: a-proteobacteria)]
TGPDEAQAVTALTARGIGEIALKRGADGATVFAGGGTTHHPGFQVEERDPTGAGDCFGGAYVTARRLGLPIAAALRLACAAGARNVTVMGPMEGAGTRAELQAFADATQVRR